MSVKSLFVTGGAGFIGSHTVKELVAEGYNVTVFDNLENGHKEFLSGEVDFIKGDLGDKELLNKIFKNKKFDAVIHFAAYARVDESIENPSKYFNNNVVNGLKLVDSMVENNIKFMIFSSSGAVYGFPDKELIDEETELKPINPYGLTKKMFEQILTTYDIAYGLKSVSLRYFNAAGANPDNKIGELRDDETHVIPLIFKGLSKRGFQVLGDDYSTEDGSAIRDYVHVTDLANAHIKALEYLSKGGESEKVNVGTGKGTSVFELIKKVEEVTGKKLDYSIAPRREGDPPKLIADNSKAKKILDWTPKYNIKDIIIHAWNWHNR